MQPDEEFLVTPEAILGTCVAGTPDAIVHQLRQMERNGLTGISLLPPAESQRKVFRDFAELVMPLMR
jgi:alkanesulfonate monooxygenase SsuD/methylene tetrahydromethanopterin reductase-like flavin-dependent oxidoreductase (luciferase family)